MSIPTGLIWCGIAIVAIGMGLRWFGYDSVFGKRPQVYAQAPTLTMPEGGASSLQPQGKTSVPLLQYGESGTLPLSTSTSTTLTIQSAIPPWLFTAASPDDPGTCLYAKDVIDKVTPLQWRPCQEP